MCKATEGHVLIHSIVAPNLLHLKYSSGEWIGLADDQWNLIDTPRYPNVTDLVLPQCGIDSSNEIANFQFPSIHHITLQSDGIYSLFGPSDNTTASMYWLGFETLTVEDLDEANDYDEDRDDLVAWL